MNYKFPPRRTSQYIDGYIHAPITLHTPQDFEQMEAVGRIASDTLTMIKPYITAGISTAEIDQILEEYMRSKGTIPATIDYHGYRHASCISVNDTLCHGVPTSKIILKDGDIVNIDITPKLNGWHGDTSRMFYVGTTISQDAKHLCEITQHALTESIALAKPGERLGAIGDLCEKIAHKNNLSICAEFCGHGIGQIFHAAPEVLHCSFYTPGPLLLPGMIFTIEPILTIGDPDYQVLDDEWTAVTKDGSLSAQFEHTIGITETGNIIFTK